MNRQKLICISCPRGCRLSVDESQGELKVSGNSCRRGLDYAVQETTDPRRVLTALMRAEGRQQPISVKTDKPIPKNMLLDCARELYKIRPELPISCGDIIVKNILGTGCDVIATCDMK